MAIAHVCTNCGIDLARVRARRDPHYGLPLVVCPACRRPSVRRRHPLARAWRRYRKLDFAFHVIAAQLLMAVLSAIFIVAVAVGAAVHDFTLPDHPEHRLFILCQAAGFALLNGCWLTAGFSHLRWSRVWAAWIGVMAFLLFVLTFATVCIGHGPGIDRSELQGMTFALRLRHVIPEQYLPWLLLLLVMTAASLPGILPGRLLLRFFGSLQSWRWRRRRRRLRAHRSGL